MSGLRMNEKNSHFVWIGSRTNCRVRFLRDTQFCWDPGIFKVLGIQFCTDTDRISEINYENKLFEIQRILKSWSYPLGKITVI